MDEDEGRRGGNGVGSGEEEEKEKKRKKSITYIDSCRIIQREGGCEGNNRRGGF